MRRVASFALISLLAESVSGLAIHYLVPSWLDWLGITLAQSLYVFSVSLLVSTVLGAATHWYRENLVVSSVVIGIFFAVNVMAMAYRSDRVATIQQKLETVLRQTETFRTDLQEPNTDCTMSYDSIQHYSELSQQALNQSQLVTSGDLATTMERFCRNLGDCVQRQRTMKAEQLESNSMLKRAEEAQQRALADSAIIYSFDQYQQGLDRLHQAIVAWQSGAVVRAKTLSEEATSYFAQSQSNSQSLRERRRIVEDSLDSVLALQPIPPAEPEIAGQFSGPDKGRALATGTGTESGDRRAVPRSAASQTYTGSYEVETAKRVVLEKIDNLKTSPTSVSPEPRAKTKVVVPEKSIAQPVHGSESREVKRAPIPAKPKAVRESTKSPIVKKQPQDGKIIKTKPVPAPAPTPAKTKRIQAITAPQKPASPASGKKSAPAVTTNKKNAPPAPRPVDTTRSGRTPSRPRR